MISLADLKPQISKIELHDHEGNLLATIPIMALSYTQWNEAELDLSPPERTEPELGGKLVDRSKTPEYIREYLEYREKITLRRVAMALGGGGGFKEFKGKTLEEQVELLPLIDSGYLNAIAEWLRLAASKKSATTFLAVPQDGNGDMQ